MHVNRWGKIALPEFHNVGGAYRAFPDHMTLGPVVRNSQKRERDGGSLVFREQRKVSSPPTTLVSRVARYSAEQ